MSDTAHDATSGAVQRGILRVLLVVCLTAAAVPAAAAAPGAPVPQGFLPSSTSWTTKARGWVLGFAPCQDGRCPILARTRDGGRTWWRTGAPQVRLPEDNRRVRVHFANGRTGLVTDGSALYVTRTGGLSWRHVELTGARPPVVLGALTHDDHAFFVVVASASGTQLFSSPLSGDRWRPVPGVALPYRAGGDVVADGTRTAVALTAVHRSRGYWHLDNGEGAPARPPCSVDADPDLGRAAGTVYALCSHHPGMGDMVKHLMRSTADGGFALFGEAPVTGITTGFAVASPSTAVVTAVGRTTALVHRSTDGGRTWETPLILPGAPLADLAFTDSEHGVLLRGGPNLAGSEVYRTSDGGATWAPLPVA
jgi:photosystem II stability/assembly factor-like uncharacterized protein